MKFAKAFCVFLFAVALTGASVALAQDDYIAQILIDTECVGAGTDTVMLTVDVNIVTELPPEAVGWVIERSVLGYCWPVEDVGEVQPFPAERTTYVLYDEPDLVGFNTIYQAYAVMESGAREQILQAYRTHWAQADCAGGPARARDARRGVARLLLPAGVPRRMLVGAVALRRQLARRPDAGGGPDHQCLREDHRRHRGAVHHATRICRCPLCPADETDWSSLKARFR